MNCKRRQIPSLLLLQNIRNTAKTWLLVCSGTKKWQTYWRNSYRCAQYVMSVTLLQPQSPTSHYYIVILFQLVCLYSYFNIGLRTFLLRMLFRFHFSITFFSLFIFMQWLKHVCLIYFKICLGLLVDSLEECGVMYLYYPPNHSSITVTVPTLTDRQ